MRILKILDAAADQPLTWLGFACVSLPLSGHTDAPFIFVAMALIVRKFKDMATDKNGDDGA